MDVKKLVVCRHADRSASHSAQGEASLTSRGHEQMRELADKLRPHVEGLRVAVVATAVNFCPHVLQSAKTLALALGVEPPIELLEDTRYERPLRLIEERDDIDVFIFFGQYEFCEGFPYCFGNRVLGVKVGICPINPGEAHVVLCDTRKSILI